jgi:hypothetical protein
MRFRREFVSMPPRSGSSGVAHRTGPLGVACRTGPFGFAHADACDAPQKPAPGMKRTRAGAQEHIDTDLGV